MSQGTLCCVIVIPYIQEFDMPLLLHLDVFSLIAPTTAVAHRTREEEDGLLINLPTAQWSFFNFSVELSMKFQQPRMSTYLIVMSGVEEGEEKELG